MIVITVNSGIIFRQRIDFFFSRSDSFAYLYTYRNKIIKITNK